MTCTYMEGIDRGRFKGIMSALENTTVNFGWNNLPSGWEMNHGSSK